MFQEPRPQERSQQQKGFTPKRILCILALILAIGAGATTTIFLLPSLVQKNDTTGSIELVQENGATTTSTLQPNTADTWTAGQG